MNNSSIETVVDGLEPIALIIKADFDKPGLHFFTPESFSQQVAYMKHSKGKIIKPHIHNLVSRQVLYTQEVLFIKSGCVRIELYSSKKKYLSSHILTSGDLILLCGGGHGLEMIEESSIIEVKQGPYSGEKDKTVFNPEE